MKRDNEYYEKYANGCADEIQMKGGKGKSDFYYIRFKGTSDDQKEFVQKKRTQEMEKMLENYKDSHYVEKKQLKSNPEINEKLYH